jgi:signal peptide peptidase SppA
MSKIIRVMQALYCEPWLITAQMHQTLCRIAHAHYTGQAHTIEASGIPTDFTNQPEPLRGWDGKIMKNVVEMAEDVSIIEVGGVIGRKFSVMLNNCGVTSVDVLESIVTEAMNNPKVKGIFLDIDSPGGTVQGVPEAARVIAAAAAVKPVVAWTGGMMCSAAYWLAAGCDAVFCTESADVGSIGVYSAFLDSSRAYEAAGYGIELFTTGKYKGMGIPGRPLTEEQKAIIQGDVDEIYDWFTGWVSSNRNVDEALFEGQSVLGPAAAKAGLADGIKSRSEALAYTVDEAKRRSGLMRA